MADRHTPGPWEWVGRTLESQASHEVCRNFADYDEVLGCDVECGPYCIGGAPKLRVSEANARLIAAAPDLLEAARDALSGWRYIRERHGDLDGVAWDRVEEALSAAIARATAQESER